MKKIPKYFCLLVLLSYSSYAHEARPIFVDIEMQSDKLLLNWRVPRSVSGTNIPSPVLPEQCQANSAVSVKVYDDTFVFSQRYDCKKNISHQIVSLSYPKFNPSLSSYFRFRHEDGEVHTQLLSPGELAWRIPDSKSDEHVVIQYVRPGIKHILSGADHLLFLLCLVLLTRTFKRTFIAVTGFTLAHSITLGLSALDIVSVPIAPIEVLIALSILFLATEIARGEDSITQKHPITVSTMFGLLHGFGLATGLQEIGLPKTEFLSSLLLFNLGIEIGQVLFILVTAGFFAYFPLAVCCFNRNYSILQIQEGLGTILIYIIGVCSVFWLLQRIRLLWI